MRRNTSFMMPSSCVSSDTIGTTSQNPGEFTGAGPMHKVNVAVRVRPLIKREKDNDATIKWKVDHKSIVHTEPSASKGSYNFDDVFGPEDTTKNIYDKVVSPIIKEAFNGYSGAVICYGQTASGKTHTLYGSENDKGIIDMCADELIDRITRSPSFVIKLNLIEVYNEAVKDLFNSKNPIDIKKDKEGTFVPFGAKDFSVVTAEQIREAAQRIQRERAIGETQMNEESSRSHTILRITISKVMGSENNEEDGSSFESSLVEAVVNLVDLAGSESASRTGAKGERLVEACAINKSLSTLAMVVRQLSEQYDKENHKSAIESSSIAKSITNSVKPKTTNSRMPFGTHVSFRDSKLTMLLKSSLGGDALVAIICHVTPSSDSVDETVSTLRFASTAKNIQVKPSRKVINKSSLPLVYEEKLTQLQLQLFDRDNVILLKASENEALRKKMEAMLGWSILRNESSSRIPLVFNPCLQSDRRKTIHCEKFKKQKDEVESFVPAHHVFKSEMDLLNLSSAEVALRKFQETKQDDEYPTLRKSEKSESLIVLKLDQEAQTELQEYETPMKKRRMQVEEDNTPVSYIRMQRSILSVAADEDRNAWEEEKKFLNEENDVLKKEIDELKEKMESQEKREILLKEIDAMKTKHAAQIEQLKQSNEYEVDLLSQRIKQRDQTIKELKNQLEGNEESGLDPLYLEKLQEEIGCLKTQLSTLKVSLQQRDTDKEVCEEELRMIKDEIKELKESKILLEEEVKKLANENATHCQEFTILKTTHEEEMQELRNSNKSAISEACLEKDQTAEKLQQQLDEVNKDILKVHDENSALLEQIDAMKVNYERDIEEARNFSKTEIEKNRIEMNQAIHERQTLLDQLNAEMLKLNDEKATIINQMQSLKMSCEKEIEQTRISHQSEIENISSEKDRVIKNNVDMMEKLNTEISKIQDENKTIQEKLIALKIHYEEEMEQLRNSYQCKLENECIAKTQADDERQQLFDELNREILKLKDEKNVLDEEMNALKINYEKEIEQLKETAESDFEKLCLEANDKQEKLEELQEELETMTEKLVQEQKKTIENLEKCLEQEDLRIKEYEIKRLEKSKIELEKEIQQLSSDKATLSQEVNTLKATYEQEIEELRNSNKSAINEACQDKDRIIEKLQQQLNEVEKDILKVHDEKTALLENIDALKVNYERDIEEVRNIGKTEIENKCAEMKQAIDERQKLLDQLNTDMETFITLKINYEEEMEQLRNSFQCKLENEYIAKTQADEERQQLIDELNRELLKLKDEKNVLDEEMNALKINYEKEIEHLKETAESDFEKLCLETNDKQERLEEMGKELERLNLLKEELQTMKGKLIEEANEKRENAEKVVILSSEITKKENLIEELMLKLQEKTIASPSVAVNAKYTEKLKEDLRCSWKDNKQLESQISDLKSLLKSKEEELCLKNSELINLKSEVVVIKSSKDESLKNEITDLKGQIEVLKNDLEQLSESRNSISEENLDLKKRLEQIQNVRRPSKVNRGSQTPVEWDQNKCIHDLKVQLKLACHRNEKLQTSNLELKRNGEKDVKRLQDELKEKSTTIDELESYILKKQKEKEMLRENQVEAGIQCDYLTELVSRAKKGVSGLLPNGFPDCGKLIKDNKALVNLVLDLEKSARVCQCNVEKNKELMETGKWVHTLKYKENLDPKSAEVQRENILSKPFVSRMGSAMNRKGRSDWSNPFTSKTQSPLVFPKTLSVLTTGPPKPVVNQRCETITTSATESYSRDQSSSLNSQLIDRYETIATAPKSDNRLASSSLSCETSNERIVNNKSLNQSAQNTSNIIKSNCDTRDAFSSHIESRLKRIESAQKFALESEKASQNVLKISSCTNIQEEIISSVDSKSENKEDSSKRDLKAEMSEWFESNGLTNDDSQIEQGLASTATVSPVTNVSPFACDDEKVPMDEDALFEAMMNMG